MQTNPIALKEICNATAARIASEVFGQDGIDAVFEIMEILWKIYCYVEPEDLQGPIIVFRPIGDISPLSKQNHDMLDDFPLLKERGNGGFVVEISKDKRLRIAASNTVNITELAEIAVVYEWQNSNERFIARAKSANVPKVDRFAHSQFSIPIFSNLRSVLQRYQIECVRYSSCPTLSGVWADGHRIFFKPKPEKDMRKSLTWFLKCRLGGGDDITEVRPEQIMDESHPVDIKISQTLSNRLAIIEIKWLGDSRKDDGSITSHRDDRARKGATQLAGYLDMNKAQASLHITKGYYVIIDGRRRGLKPDTTSITSEDGLHYKDVEIDFDVRYDESRDDFEKPIRMFAEPNCTPATIALC